MLAHRVIPSLLVRNGALVKGVAFNSWRSIGSPPQAIRTHQARGVDEIIVLDIGATPEGRGPDFEMVARLTEGCFSPITVGGGVRSVEDVRRLLASGADKVAICTGGPKLIGECAVRFGCQAIVAALDVKDGHATVRCGTHTTLQPAVGWARVCESEGAGEILLTSIDRDGTLEGYDLDLIKAVSAAVSIPVIANGGAGTYEHMRQAIEAGASAVAAGAIFAWTDATPRGAAEYLKAHSIHARIPA